MAEYIDREKLYIAGENTKMPEYYFSDPFKAMHWQGQKIKELILTAPAEDVAPVKRGKWEKFKICGCNVCNICHAIVDRKSIRVDSGKLNYCPNCGAYMTNVKNSGAAGATPFK